MDLSWDPMKNYLRLNLLGWGVYGHFLRLATSST